MAAVDPLERRVIGAVAVVALGGAIGTLARYAIDLTFPAAGIDGPFPWPTLLVNLVGCILIGALSGVLSRDAWWVRPFVVTGMLGGFTTMSAVALQSGELLDDGAWFMVAVYLGATLIAGLAGVMVGERLTASAHDRQGGGRR